MRVLSIDPGREEGVSAGSGWCYQNPDTVLALGVVRDLMGFMADWNLDQKPVDVLVIEEYSIKGHQFNQNVGIKLVPVEHIGAVRMWARLNKIEVVEYDPSKKPIQCKATGVTPKNMPKAIEHQWDAYNHGRYYLIQKGLAPSALEIKMKAEGLL
jgi:hypothetical protein